MFSVGLTGGIASGKSTIAARLVTHGAHHVDADQLARLAVEPGSEGLRAITDAFGPSFLNPDGTLKRAALGRRVFSDHAALAHLNDILHPAIEDLNAQILAQLNTTDPEGVVVVDAALLVEADAMGRFELIVIASASQDVRLRRLVELRGMSDAEAHQRIAAQSTEGERLAQAHFVISTEGTLNETHCQVDALWEHISFARASGRA